MIRKRLLRNCKQNQLLGLGSDASMQFADSKKLQKLEMKGMILPKVL